MPRTDITEVRRFDKFQGIDVRDDAESNTAADILNLVIDSTGRLTRAKEAEAIPNYTEDIKDAYYYADNNGVEVNANVDTVIEAPQIDRIESETSSNVKIYAKGDYKDKCFDDVNKIILLKSRYALISGEDFTFSLKTESGTQVLDCNIQDKDIDHCILITSSHNVVI